MRVEYLPSFLKDLRKLKSSSTYAAVRKLAFEEMLDYPNLQEVRNLQKLKDSDVAYRISKSYRSFP